MSILSNEQYAAHLTQLVKQHNIYEYGKSDYQGRIADEIIEFLRESKVFYQLVPEEMGGGDSVSRWLIALREVGAQCNTTVHMMTTQSLAVYALRLAGELKSKKAIYHSLINVEKQSCFCLTEPSGGSDASEMQSVARKTEDGYLITGDKCMIMNADFADYFLIAAKLEGIQGYAAITLFLVPKEAPGITVMLPDQTMGARGVPINSIHFKNVPVAASMVVGGEGNGWKIITSVLDRTRPGVAAAALGGARTAMEKAILYTQKRIAFGKALAKFQTVSNRNADMAIKWKSAWLMVEDAGRKIDAKDTGITLASSMAKIAGTEAAYEIANQALLNLGGYGFLEEYGLAAICRNMRTTTIYDGTNDVLRGMVSGGVTKEIREQQAPMNR